MTCTPKERSRPEIVIPVYERDICKLKYTARSISKYDPNRLFSDVHVMWVSAEPIDAYKDEIAVVKAEIEKTRLFHFYDLSEHVKAAIFGGWFAQQVYKLKVASVVTSEYYMALDSKNTLMREVTKEMFWDECNRPLIINAKFPFAELPPPHGDWLAGSAKVLNVPVMADMLYPTSITPFIMHTRTVLEILNVLKEGVSMFGQICNGDLCKALGAELGPGKPDLHATEFGMYIMWIYSRPYFDCMYALVGATNMGMSLWRGGDSATEDKTNIDKINQIAAGVATPLMFGAQAGALEGLPPSLHGLAVNQLMNIFKDAKLLGKHETSPEDFVQCVVARQEDA